jgi:hypothetical protein
MQYILGTLTDEFDLDLSVTLYIEDFLALLHYHWCFGTSTVPHERCYVQFPSLMFMTASVVQTTIVSRSASPSI